METTVTVKGQVTIPKRIRDSQGFAPGSKVVFDVNDAGETVILQSISLRCKGRTGSIARSASPRSSGMEQPTSTWN